MPYFVYKILPDNQLKYYDTFDNYREAKQLVFEERKNEPKGSNATIRMMHAVNQAEAERLLTAPRDDRIIGDD
jgi:hypothetical protein